MSYDPSRPSPPLSSPDRASHAPSQRSLEYQQDDSTSLSSGASRSAAAPPPSSSSAPRIRRRNRMITSCLECRRRKLKCDKQQPCANCTKFTRDCLFLAPALDSASQLKLTEIKEKMGTLERVLEQDVARNGAWRDARRAQVAVQHLEDEIDFAPVPEDERDLEPTPMAVGDAVYDQGDDEVEDEFVDLGVAMGKMRLTDRIGGFFRPKMSEEMSVNLRKDGSSMSPSPQSTTRPANFMAPGPTYLPPASSFFFAPNTRGNSLVEFLPTRTAADHLISQYWYAVHPICRILHRQSFERRYEMFWNELRQGIEPVGSLQALVFSAMFSGVVSMSEEAIASDFGVSKKEVLESFQQGVESALSRAQVLRTTKTETMQAFVMYLLPLCRDQMSRSHSALVGAAIRLAECMGLHRDGTFYGLPPTEVHVRRMIWYQLAILDIRTCEAQGPRPGIREGEFDTKLPLNIDDIELEQPNPPTGDADQWTDMTVTLIRTQCNEMYRVIWIDRPRLEKKQISLTAVLGKIENFKRVMHEKYLPLINSSPGENDPLRQFTRIMMTVLIARMYIIVLHRYHNSVSAKIPERLRAIIRETGTDCIEAAMALETLPQLEPWKWYTGALQQYHTAFLLMADVYQYPDSPEADRIWRVLDYVFEPPQPSAPREVKALYLLTEIRDRLGAFHAKKRTKAPINLMQRLGDKDRDGRLNGEKELFFIGGPGGEKTRSEADSMSPKTESVGDPPSMVALQQQQQQSGGMRAGMGGVGMGMGASVSPEAAGQVDDLMADIDWNEWDKLFPTGSEAIGGVESRPGILPPSSQSGLGGYAHGNVISGSGQDGLGASYHASIGGDQAAMGGYQSQQSNASMGGPQLGMGEYETQEAMGAYEDGSQGERKGKQRQDGTGYYPHTLPEPLEGVERRSLYH